MNPTLQQTSKEAWSYATFVDLFNDVADENGDLPYDNDTTPQKLEEAYRTTAATSLHLFAEEMFDTLRQQG